MPIWMNTGRSLPTSRGIVLLYPSLSHPMHRAPKPEVVPQRAHRQLAGDVPVAYCGLYQRHQDIEHCIFYLHHSLVQHIGQKNYFQIPVAH
jgi:hypothetical protein